jgi:hypothetical protein
LLWRDWDKAYVSGVTNRTNVNNIPATLSAQATRLATTVDFSIDLGHSEKCNELLLVIDRVEAHTASRYANFYTPLIQKLLPILNQKNISITTHPFNSFFRSLLRGYLVDKLPLPATNVSAD